MISTLSRKHNFDLVFDSQKMFRLLLKAMSNPARIVNIHEYASTLFGDQPAFLALALTLLDNNVSFNAYEDRTLSAEITSLTHTKRAGLESADFIFISVPDKTKEVIGSIKYGTLSNPHKSATVIIRNDDDPVYPLVLTGPGINECIAVKVSKTARDAIRLRDAQNYEYPQGIDMIFVSSAGELFAIPRHVAC